MDELNNRQIILLTMLVSFVVSTATGIMTVAMLEEAPPTLTQTVNRVVERTIERVVAGTSTPEKPAPAPVTTITKEVTIYAKEDDLITDAVEKNQPRIARIYGAGTATSSSPDAIGVVISRDGYVVADRTTLLGVETDKSIVSVLIGDKTYVGTVLANKEIADEDVALIRLNVPAADTPNPISFGQNLSPKIAQSLILLGGTDGDGVTRSNVSKLIMSKPIGTSTVTYLSAIDVSPKIPEGYEGGLVVNLDGQSIGVVIKGESGRLTVYPAGRILDLVDRVTASGKQAEASKEKTQTASVGAVPAR